MALVVLVAEDEVVVVLVATVVLVTEVVKVPQATRHRGCHLSDRMSIHHLVAEDPKK